MFMRKIVIIIASLFTVLATTASAYDAYSVEGISLDRFIENMHSFADMYLTPDQLPVLEFSESSDDDYILQVTAHEKDFSIIIDSFAFDKTVDAAYFVAKMEQPGGLSENCLAFLAAFLLAPKASMPVKEELEDYIGGKMEMLSSSTELMDGMGFSKISVGDYITYIFVSYDGIVMMHIYTNDMFSPESGIVLAKELLNDLNRRVLSAYEIYSYNWYAAILNMQLVDAFTFLGIDYENTGSGAEGSLPGYAYNDLGITLGSYSMTFDTIDFIECWDNARVGDIEAGMTLHEIEAQLGAPNKALDGDFISPYVWYYYLPPLEISFSAYDSLDAPTYSVFVELMD